jgi:phospholipid/cholesterol/gamma-HCH transport system substrate-binding protein
VETKVNYAIVGAFVLLLSAAILGGVLWISAGRTARKAYDPYAAYFNESVSGLNLNAPVKYRGVVVGSVREISLDPEDPEKVRLLLWIERGVPIKQDTMGVLSVQGLTGIAFVDLGGGTRASPPLEPDPATGIPVIATRPSLLRRLDAGATALAADLSQTAQSIQQLMDEPTRMALQRTIRDLDAVTHVIAARSEDIDASLVAAARATQNGAKVSAELEPLARQVASSAEAVQRAAAEVSRAGAAVRAAADAAAGGAERLGARTLPDLERLLGEARAVTASLGRVAQELERNPNALVMGREPPPPGPGE